ncbi:Galactosyltransferase [Handroanthus impetiginosus]|uniref:Galactosyltransferase n=1 Tax=Handroanthus impetiginosus TaxID=429701 RepID=A0A2G9GH41_9LAMI|nr:Galactosyltransferase [Handroanthus impetiginosus]
MVSPYSSDKFSFNKPPKFLLILGLTMSLIYIFLSNQRGLDDGLASAFFSPVKKNPPPATNLSHLVFGILGSEKAWQHRKAYIESWWRPNATYGLLYLDKPPTGDLLPWSEASPPYRVSDDLAKFLQETKARLPAVIRMVHGIMEVFREFDNENLRWVVMGDDDSIFFVDNIVDVLAEYDHRKYYYLGGQSEFIMSNYWFSFNQGFGGAGFMLSYPLAKALANDMENCLRRYSQLDSSDLIIMVCIADIGVNLSPKKGIHQIDLHGDISGFLSSHPKFPLMSLHHFDKVDPIFPNMDRFESMRHLMKAAAVDQSRMLQQTICHHRQSNWSFSISWGYSAHIYEKIMPRSYLQNPIETFKGWSSTPRPRPHYMFDTRLPSSDSCEAPHVFFFERVERTPMEILTTYSRVWSRGLPRCWWNGSHTADFISEVHVFSPATKRKEMDRCECCDVVRVNGPKAELKFRECMINEIIA